MSKKDEKEKDEKSDEAVVVVVPAEPNPRIAELEFKLAEFERKLEATEAWAQQCAVLLSRHGLKVPARG